MINGRHKHEQPRTRPQWSRPPKHQGKRKEEISSFYVQGPREPPVLVAAEAAADAKEKVAAGEHIQVELRRRLLILRKDSHP
jgi:hypothetical protein